MFQAIDSGGLLAQTLKFRYAIETTCGIQTYQVKLA